MKHQTSITDNEVGGDLAGRDLSKVYNYNFGISEHSTLKRLIEEFKKKEKEDAFFKGVVEKLEHYKKSVDDDDDVIGLEEKLDRGGYSDLLYYAKNVKEMFVKKLAKYQFNEAAQKIHAYFLSEVYTRFHRHVYSLIIAGQSKEIINHQIQKNIIDPILAMLDENVTELYAEEIDGMVYFLTGNCHIKWTAE